MPPTRQLIIAIDGPSGAGKSTLSRALAEALGYLNIDTGAMYRSVAYLAYQSGINPDNQEALARLCADLEIRFEPREGTEGVLVNGQDVTRAIRTPEVSRLTPKVAACSAVRAAMLRLQRQLGGQGGVVLEGRDIGTVVFPAADIKFFLSASVQERGRRRYQELRAQGKAVELDQTIAEVAARDAADSEREQAPLRQAEDAIPIDSSQLTIDQVLEVMLRIVREQRFSDPPDEQ